MRLTRMWPLALKQALDWDERRVREFIESPAGVSESAESLAAKLGISQRRCRSILESLVEQGLVRRREFGDIAPVYFRFPSR
ncbi:MAG: hypothetical protein M3336_03650 [Chloroflexota bacterium]|nr:hypothetical protein [Chloroflexota bacterium]